MSDQMQIGNVTFHKNDVKSTSVTYKDGQKLNSVWLNNGTKLEFKDQEKDARASVTTGSYAGENYGPYGTGFNGIKGLHIEGSKGDDFYHISNCEDYDVDVKNGGNDRVRIFDKNGKTNGTVNADQNDKVEFANGIGMMNMNEGLFFRNN